MKALFCNVLSVFGNEVMLASKFCRCINSLYWHHLPYPCIKYPERLLVPALNPCWHRLSWGSRRLKIPKPKKKNWQDRCKEISFQCNFKIKKNKNKKTLKKYFTPMLLFLTRGQQIQATRQMQPTVSFQLHWNRHTQYCRLLLLCCKDRAE